MKRISIVSGVLLVTFGAAWLFWPERYAVNGPMLHILFGRHSKTPPAPGSLLAPPGWSVSRFVAGTPNLRLLRLTPDGDLLASQPRAGRVLLFERDDDGDGRADGVRTLVEGLDRPHGLDLYDGWLYVAESGAVRRVRFDSRARAVRGPSEVVIAGLPEGGNHWTRTLRFGPDGALYVSIGSSCNVCVESDPRRAAIVRYRPDGRGEELFATGLRNSVGFDWNVAGDLYATDNGRDLLGDDFPPCELNRIVSGGFYGWPRANGMRVPDPDLGAGHDADVARSLPPVHGFRAHNAPLGITFLRSEHVPEAYRGAALVALHGSWNRTRKDGYVVVSLHWGPDGRIEEREFLTGFRDGEAVFGRPVDVAEGPDGAIYVSDDFGGAILRVTYGGAAASAGAATTPSAHAPAVAYDSASVARGAELYAEHRCATCHERTDAANRAVVVRPLVGLASRYDVASLAAFLLAPTPPMPAVDLSDAARRDLAAYLLTRP